MIEIKICPDCPFKKYMIYLSQQSYTTTPNKKTALRTCQELRVIAKSFGEECKHFKGETLDNFLFFGASDRQKSEELNREDADATSERSGERR